MAQDDLVVVAHHAQEQAVEAEPPGVQVVGGHVEPAPALGVEPPADARVARPTGGAGAARPRRSGGAADDRVAREVEQVGGRHASIVQTERARERLHDAERRRVRVVHDVVRQAEPVAGRALGANTASTSGAYASRSGTITSTSAGRRPWTVSKASRSASRRASSSRVGEWQSRTRIERSAGSSGTGRRRRRVGRERVLELAERGDEAVGLVRTPASRSGGGAPRSARTVQKSAVRGPRARAGTGGGGGRAPSPAVTA